MERRRVLLASFGAMLTMCVCPGSLAQIDPPPGPVADTMRTLAEVEPRVPVSTLAGDASAVHVITEPGAYYLTEDVVGEAGKHGIEIRLAPGVTGSVSIDFNRFSLIGVPGSLDGVHCIGATMARGGEPVSGINVSLEQICKGCNAIGGWGGDGIHCESIGSVGVSGIGIDGCGGDGVDVSNVDRCEMGDLTITDVVGHGIALNNVTSTFGVQEEGIKITNPGGDGVNATNCRTLVFPHLLEQSGGIRGVFVEDTDYCDIGECLFYDLTGTGIEARRVGKFKAGAELAKKVNIANPGGDGMWFEDCAEVILLGFVITGAMGDGVNTTTTAASSPPYFTYVLKDCIITSCVGNGTSFDFSTAPASSSVSVLLEDVESGDNGLRGSMQKARHDAAMATIQNMRARVAGNGTDGIYCEGFDSCVIDRCVAVGNGGNGYHVQEVTVTKMMDSASCRNGGSGGECDDGRADVARCTFDGNTGNGFEFSSTGGIAQVCVLEMCTASGNQTNGFFIDGSVGGSVRHCRAATNSGLGVHLTAASSATRVEGNSCAGNGGGLQVDGVGNYVVCNSVTTGPLGGLSIAAGNAAGPTFDAAGVETQCSAHANVVH